MKKIIKFLMCLPNTIYLNFKVFPIKTAIKFPVFIGGGVKLHNLYPGCIILPSKIYPNMISIGIADGTVGIPLDKENGSINFGRFKGKLIFQGKAQFAKGVNISVRSGTIEFGNKFVSNRLFFIASANNIKFGENVLCGDHVSIRDMDGHPFYYLTDLTNPVNEPKAITIEDHVWICSHVDILKGTKISKDSIVGYRSLVTNVFDETNVIVAGSPAKIIKKNIQWRY